MMDVQILHSTLPMRKLRFCELKKLPNYAQLCHWYTQSPNFRQSAVHGTRELQKVRPCCLSGEASGCISSGQSRQHELGAKALGQTSTIEVQTRKTRAQTR